MICEGIIPEAIRPIVERDEEGVPHDRREVVPAHQCDAEATVLARSMEQRVCDLDWDHWVKTEDHVYCPRHVVPGTMTYLDGNVAQHAPMAVSDA